MTPRVPGIDPGSSPPREAPDARFLVSAASWMSGANLVAQGIAYAALLVLARLIPPDAFGTVAAGTAVVWMAITVLDSGTRGGIIVRPTLTHSALRKAFRRCMGIALVLAAAMAIVSPQLVDAIAEGGESATFAVLAVSLPLYALSLIPTAVLQRVMQFGRLARLTGAANAGSAGVAVVAGFAGAGVWALVARQVMWFALLAVLAIWVARPFLPRPGAAMPDREPARVGDRWFLLFGATLLIALNLDYLVIGGVDGVGELGLYALAFMIAFAPLQQFSGEVGKVLLSAAAASGLRASGARTAQAVRLMSVVLLPILPAAIVLAPSALPAILGEEWTNMVTPFQILLVVGIGQAIVNCVGETLAGAGEIAFRAKVNLVWCAATAVALVVLVPLDGIRGAALAHLVIFVPYAAVYGTIGARRAGTDARELWLALRPTVLAVLWQSAATVAVYLALGGAGDLRVVLAAATGLVVVAVLLWRDPRGPARQALALLRPGDGG